jgi:hypothetical protein
LRKVDKGTQTLLRIPTKPTFYIRYPWSTINRWIWLFINTFLQSLLCLNDSNTMWTRRTSVRNITEKFKH